MENIVGKYFAVEGDIIHIVTGIDKNHCFGFPFAAFIDMDGAEKYITELMDLYYGGRDNFIKVENTYKSNCGTMICINHVKLMCGITDD